VTPKKAAIQVVEALPDDCTWDDVLREMRGFAASERGDTLEEPAVNNAREGGMSRTYDVVVERDEEGYFVASVPELHGCHTQASTLEQLMERVREAIELCLEVSSTDEGQFIGIHHVTVAA
jgi:predicted RNase H-like HicB family nuclease